MSGPGPDMWRKSQCCGGKRDEVVQVDLFSDGRVVGLVGLTTIFEQLYALGRSPDAAVQDELVKMVAAKNYVPPNAEDVYGRGLVREYAKFCDKKQKSERQSSAR